MILYSQRDPSWASKGLPNSNLTLGSHGCYLTSIAMLGQVQSPAWLCDQAVSRGGFTSGGLLVSGVLAQICGMEYVGKSATPDPTYPCIAVTDKYAKSGIPTHFYVKLPDGRRVDPYDLTPVPEVDDFNITEYRIFRNVKLSVMEKESVFEAPSPITIPDWAADVVAKCKAKNIKTDLTRTAGDIPLYHLLKLLQKFFL